MARGKRNVRGNKGGKPKNAAAKVAAEEARKAEEAKKAADEAKKAEEARKAEEAKKAAEAKKAEEARKVEEAKKEVVRKSRKKIFEEAAAKGAERLKKQTNKQEYLEYVKKVKAKQKEYNSIEEDYKQKLAKKKELRGEIESLNAKRQKIQDELNTTDSIKRKEKLQTQLEELTGKYETTSGEFEELQAEAGRVLIKLQDVRKEFGDLSNEMREKAGKLLNDETATEAERESYEQDIEEIRDEAASIQKQVLALEAEKNREATTMKSRWSRIKSAFTRKGRAENEADDKVRASVAQKNKELAALRGKKQKLTAEQKRIETSLKGLTRNQYVDRGEVSQEAFDAAAKKVNERAAAVDSAETARMLFAQKKGKNYYKKSAVGKQEIANCIKDSDEITKVIEGLMKAFPTGVPYPGEKFLIIRPEGAVLSKEEKESGNWIFEDGKYMRTGMVEYDYIIKQLELAFGEGGHINRLANSPFTDQSTGRMGFVNLAQGAMEAWKKLQLETSKSIFDKVMNLAAAGGVPSAESAKYTDAIKEKGIAMVKEVKGCLQNCGEIYKDNISKKEMTEAEKKALRARLDEIEELKKSIQKPLEDFSKECKNGTTAFGSILPKFQATLDIANALTVVFPKGGVLIGAARKIFVGINRIIDIFDIKEAKSPRMDVIQQQLSVYYKKLSKAYSAANELYLKISKEFLVSMNKQNGGSDALTGNARKTYDEFMNDWKELVTKVLEFNKTCIDLANGYKQRKGAIHIHEHTRKLQKAKATVAQWMRRGVFNTKSKVPEMIA